MQQATEIAKQLESDKNKDASNNGPNTSTTSQKLEKKDIKEKQETLVAQSKKPPTTFSLQIFNRKNRIKQVLAVLAQHKRKLLEKLSSTEDSSHKLPPLVFFVAHANTAVFSLILEQLPYLKKMGYSRICFEHDNDKTLNDAILDLERSRANFEREKEEHFTKDIDENGKRYFEYAQIYQDVIIKPHLAFLKKIKEQESWLKYVGIDGPITKFRTHDFAELLDEDPEIDEAREHCFALTTTTAAEESLGGTLVITGYGHSKIQEKLEFYRKQTIQNYLFFDFFPLCEERFMSEELEASVKQTAFKYKPIPLDTTKDMDKLMTAFQECVGNQVSLLSQLSKETDIDANKQRINKKRVTS